MRIAQVAPLSESVPPKLYGGTERIVSYLTEELVRQGHDVTLFASGDSRTQAQLISSVPRALRLEPDVINALPYHIMSVEEVRARAQDFDVIHFHFDIFPLTIVRAMRTAVVFTQHGRLDLPDIWPCYRAFSEVPLVSISNHQRLPLSSGVNWVGTVYHGLPPHLLPYEPEPEGGYLAFLGRISPEKRPDRAIEIAVRAGKPLKIAAKIDRVDQTYWDEEIAPLVARHPNVSYIGEVDEAGKAQFLGNADALLVPIDWPEPFGLVMIEAMSCGTPVVAFANGSVPEVVEDGISGFVVRDVGDAVAAVGRLGALDRSLVRDAFERRFSVARMTADYLAVYRRLTGQPASERPTARSFALRDREGLRPPDDMKLRA